MILILGGTASGKSEFAERYAVSLGGSVCYVATADPRDAEMRRRIENHRARRPEAWYTLEVQRGLGEALAAAPPSQVVILESLGMLVTNHLGSQHRRSLSLPRLRGVLQEEVGSFTRACGRRGATVIMVSEEVGLGIVPVIPLARRFTDVLSWMNQQVAFLAEEVYLVVAGIPIHLKASGGTAGGHLSPTPNP
ncbi:MAG: bifunctional adenosylcobinamide kinase/adenosylcobinamide-phosphate guanylyltransferase [candidate division NC10 bacterium]|nr:bifunctional adenosylcobinamide kinase/adenosylcobinamide-phosphate guanylyltransferase [candidate division NC10 bacterium]